MAKDKDELKRYVSIALRLKDSPESVSNDELKFFSSYTPEINQGRLGEINAELDKLKNEGKQVDPNLTAEALLLSTQQSISSPQVKDRILQVAQETEAGKNFNKLAEGLNILLAGTDVAQSLNQISQAKQIKSTSKRPTTPVIPQRDQYLQQALRNQQEGNFGVSQAIAPAQAEIADQYRADLQNAKTASTGQAGAFGSYAQSAANRRNRASLNLVPLGNEVKQQNVNNYNHLLGLRQQETQNQFNNQVATYPYDLQQYQLEQQMAGHLQGQGYQNLRNSLPNLGGGLADVYSKILAKRRYDQIRRSMDMYGHGDTAMKAQQTLDNHSGYTSPEDQYTY